MKKFSSLIILLLFVIFLVSFPAHAQEVTETPEVAPTETEVDPGVSQEPQPLSGPTTQRNASSNVLCIKVGNPVDEKPSSCSQPTITGGTIGIGGNQGIVQAASQIVPLLSKGSDGLLNVKADERGVYYWCTFLIADSYNMAGISGVTRGSHAAVVTMKAFFANTPGFTLLAPSTAAEEIQPGDVVFFEGSGQHVSLVKSVELNENGDGAIHTYDSNNVVTEDVISVKNHTAQRANTTARLYSITGFGRAVQ